MAEDGGQKKKKKKWSKLLTVCPFILGTELCERLAYYGLATNLVMYLATMGLSPASSSIVVYAFTGTSYSAAVLGGVLADMWWGRYRTILYSSIIYCVGMILLATSALVPSLHPVDGASANRGQWFIFYTSLLFVSLGTGGIKPNVSAFGADQFDDNDPEDAKAKQSFFNWFYLAINIGAFIAATVIVYIQTYVSWGIGFLIPGVAMFLAVMLFLAGTPLYKHVLPDSAVARVFNVIACALGARWKSKGQTLDRNRDSLVQKPLLGSSLIGERGEDIDKSHWLDAAVGPDRFTRQQVYEVKLVWGAMPVFLTTIIYWAVYSQMSTFFVDQGALMNRSIGNFRIPAASLSLFDTISIIILVPIYDRIAVPMLEMCTRRPSLLERIGWGYVFAVLAMIVSSLIEWVRLSKFKNGDILSYDGEEIKGEVVNMSVWWQSFQYVGIGVSEILASIGSLDFFYDQAPDSMRSVMLSICLVSIAFGGYLAALLTWALNLISEALGHQWIPENINLGRLDLLYLALGGLMVIDTIWYCFIALKYKYKEVTHSTGGSTTE